MLSVLVLLYCPSSIPLFLTPLFKSQDILIQKTEKYQHNNNITTLLWNCFIIFKAKLPSVEGQYYGTTICNENFSKPLELSVWGWNINIFKAEIL